ncbi:exonuclease GOR-like [Palaemon carinicauda]|uniref:exonuclease GOR-like n=1 Tax=Palaemon carinicauda TaxID=392227 RepID=UPI0035B691A5
MDPYRHYYKPVHPLPPRRNLFRGRDLYGPIPRNEVKWHNLPHPSPNLDGLGQYEKFERNILSEHAMVQNSFPRPHPSVDGQAVISNATNRYSQIPNNETRECSRCGAVYSVQENGKAVKPEICKYHPHKTQKSFPHRCCQGIPGTKPCKIALQHVFEAMDLDNLTGFLRTKDNISVTSREVYAVDTEMIYTEGGLEVGCLSIVNIDCNVVYQTVIVPSNHILDYNTEMSKLSPLDFVGETTTIKRVHEKLQTLWGPNTILVGHGLERDLLKLRVIHDKVVDTQVLYPHNKGPPFLNSLHNLKERYLSHQKYAKGSYKCSNEAIAVMSLTKLRV